MVEVKEEREKKKDVTFSKWWFVCCLQIQIPWQSGFLCLEDRLLVWRLLVLSQKEWPKHLYIQLEMSLLPNHMIFSFFSCCKSRYPQCFYLRIQFEFKTCKQLLFNYQTIIDTTQSAGGIEYTDYISALVMLELQRMQSIPSLPSLPGPLWPGVVAPNSVLLIDQIKLFDI